MSSNPLDILPDADWFMGVDLHSATVTIASIGILHALAFVHACLQHCSYLFITIYALVIMWTAVSCAFFIGIINETEVAYLVWEWYTLVFALLMVLLMALLVVVCLPRSACLPPWFAIGFYVFTMYMVCVVNTYRKQVFYTYPLTTPATLATPATPATSIQPSATTAETQKLRTINYDYVTLSTLDTD